MKLFILIAILTTVAVLALGVVVALYRHKKGATDDLVLVGEQGWVDSELDPEGTVIVHGELWRAKSINGTPISAKTRVKVVGIESHLVLVEVCD